MRCVLLLLAAGLLFAAPRPAPARGHRSARAEREAPPLTAADRSLLDGLFKQFLFDPQGAQFVRVTMTYHTVNKEPTKVTRSGWLLPGKPGDPPRVAFEDGPPATPPAPADIHPADFRAACDKFFDRDDERPRGPARLRENFIAESVGLPHPTILALAAWSYRLGHDDLAAVALQEARSSLDEPVAELRQALAWSAYVALVHDYVAHADATAQFYGERLLRLYPHEAQKKFPGAQLILNDLKRRQRSGSFGRSPQGLPADFASWDPARKTAYLIGALDEVDAPEDQLEDDPRLAALVAVGNAALPVLIDTIEKDPRLTRAVRYGSDFPPSRGVLDVRMVAFAAVGSLIRLPRVVSMNRVTETDLPVPDPAAIRKIVTELRAYWQKFGPMSLEERLIYALQHPDQGLYTPGQAAATLVRLGEPPATLRRAAGDAAPRPPNLLLAKFNQPTAAEVILAAMDRELARAPELSPERWWQDKLRAITSHTPAPAAPDTSWWHTYRERYVCRGYHPIERETGPTPSNWWDSYREPEVDEFLEPLMRLGDPRLAPELARRSQAAATLSMRSKWALAAHVLGDGQPLAALVTDLRAGKLRLPVVPPVNARDLPDSPQLRSLIVLLGRAHTPASEAALTWLVTPGQPYYKLVTDNIRQASPSSSRSLHWLAHPYCLPILRAELESRAPIPGHGYSFSPDYVTHRQDKDTAVERLPDFLRDPARRRPQAPEHRYDYVAAQLQLIVLGLPLYHPLATDADSRLAKVRDYLDRFAGKFRQLSAAERLALEKRGELLRFVPDLPPLGRAATAADVQAGRALFTLGGKGQPAQVPLPAVARRKNDRQEESAKLFLVQAEVGANGEITYGFFGPDGFGVLPASALTPAVPVADVVPLP